MEIQCGLGPKRTAKLNAAVICFCWMVIPKTRASAGAAGGALGALEVMMASVHRAAILNTRSHQTFLND